MPLRNIQLPLEKFAKLINHDKKIASLRTHHREKTYIKSSMNGTAHFDTGSFAIFVIYQPFEIPWYVRNALEALNRQQTNVIAVLNFDASPLVLVELKKHCNTILIRSNQGFDIGGYRDATLYLQQANRNIENVIYMNDSIYYFQNGLDQLFERLLTSASPVVTAFENTRENDYHYQSFLFRVNGQIFRDERFKSFWQSYLPVSSRLYAIDEGEKGITRVLQEISSEADVIFTASGLTEAIKSRSNTLILEYSNPAQQVVNNLPTGLRFSAWGSPIFYLSKLETAVRSYSQVHSGGFLYRIFLDSPILKRDLYYREFYSGKELDELLGGINTEGHLSCIQSDLRRKGSRSDLSRWGKAKFDIGVI